MPCCAHAVLCRGLENSLSDRHDRSTAWARRGNGMGTAWHVSISLYCQRLVIVSRDGKLARISYF